MQRLITLTTDFGESDHYVGAMKGVVLTINPAAQIVDICNSVHSYDVLDGALTIAQAYRYFPTDSVHMVIVDPGVGKPVTKQIEEYTDIYSFLFWQLGVEP